METRPGIRPLLTTGDRIMEVTALLLLVLIWVFALLTYSDLPENIPIHFNFRGEADDYGNRNSYLFLPVIVTIVYAGMTLLNRYPHIYNYPVTITVDNAERMYGIASRLIRVLKLIIVCIFATLIFLTRRAAMQNTDTLGIWFLPAAVVILVTCSIFYLVKIYRMRVR